MAVRYLERVLDMIALFALVAIIIATPFALGACVASIPPTFMGLAMLPVVGFTALALGCLVWSWTFHQLSRVLNEHAVANLFARIKGDQWMRRHGYMLIGESYVYID